MASARPVHFPATPVLTSRALLVAGDRNSTGLKLQGAYYTGSSVQQLSMAGSWATAWPSWALLATISVPAHIGFCVWGLSQLQVLLSQ